MNETCTSKIPIHVSPNLIDKSLKKSVLQNLGKHLLHFFVRSKFETYKPGTYSP